MVRSLLGATCTASPSYGFGHGTPNLWLIIMGFPRAMNCHEIGVLDGIGFQDKLISHLGGKHPIIIHYMLRISAYSNHPFGWRRISSPGRAPFVDAAGTEWDPVTDFVRAVVGASWWLGNIAPGGSLHLFLCYPGVKRGKDVENPWETPRKCSSNMWLDTISWFSTSTVP